MALSDKQNKYLKKINTAGQSAETMGWAVLFFVSLLMLAVPYPRGGLVFLWVISMAAGLYYIYSGRYIQYGDGTKNLTYLRANAILTIFFIPSLIPIIVLAQSIGAASAYKKLTEELGKPNATGKPVDIKTKHIVIASLLVVLSLGVLVYRLQNPLTSTDTSQSASNGYYSN